MKCPFVIKICSKCNKILVANSMNFRKKNRGKYGLYSICRECDKSEMKKWHSKNKDHDKEYKEKYRKENKEKIKEYNRTYYEENIEKEKERCKKYQEENKESIKRRKKEWRKENPDKQINYHHKRRQLKEQQGNGITKEQWLEMMKFFNWRCAYSGVTLDKGNRTIDHIISLNKGGQHEIWNMIPMLRNYNCSKQDKDMLEWYIQQDFYLEERLNKIYEWIEYAKNKYQK